MVVAEVFAEDTTERRYSWNRGVATVSAVGRHGVGFTRSARQSLQYEWMDLSVVGETALKRLPAEMATFFAGLGEATSQPEDWNDVLRSMSATLEAHACDAGAERLQLAVFARERKIGYLDDTGFRRDRSARIALELRPFVRGARGSGHVVRFFDFADLAALSAAIDSMGRLLPEMVAAAGQAAKPVPLPESPTTIVLPPGSGAAALFHEVCGHPMEADVLLRGVSYLSRLQGRLVAPEFVSVVDDPAAGGHYEIDDEGQPAACVHLIENGRVGEALFDAVAASRTGRASNGHGRRVSFQHVALPRMSHTAVLPHRGTLNEIVAEVDSGLLVHLMTPRHVSIASGDFSFWIDEARLIEGGEVTNYVQGGILRGNGLTTLGNIDAVGGVSVALHGVKGCRKLDHGPLPVSFAVPAIRIRNMAVEHTP